MNQFILNIMIVYSIASIVYLIYSLVSKSTKMSDILTEQQMEEYNKIKKRRTMVFIIGVVIGLCFIIVFDKTSISLPDTTIKMKLIVEDVSDISVI